jgi:hypothetical protein
MAHSLGVSLIGWARIDSVSISQEPLGGLAIVRTSGCGRLGRLVLSLDSETIAPPAGAADSGVTLQVEVAAPWSQLGLHKRAQISVDEDEENYVWRC